MSLAVEYQTYDFTEDGLFYAYDVRFGFYYVSPAEAPLFVDDISYFDRPYSSPMFTLVGDGESCWARMDYTLPPLTEAELADWVRHDTLPDQSWRPHPREE